LCFVNKNSIIFYSFSKLPFVGIGHILCQRSCFPCEVFFKKIGVVLFIDITAGSWIEIMQVLCTLPITSNTKRNIISETSITVLRKRFNINWPKLELFSQFHSRILCTVLKRVQIYTKSRMFYSSLSSWIFGPCILLGAEGIIVVLFGILNLTVIVLIWC